MSENNGIDYVKLSDKLDTNNKIIKEINDMLKKLNVMLKTRRAQND